MARLDWTTDLNTGIDVIDKQHRKIVEYINELDNIIGDDGNRDRVALVIHGLVRYTTSHFQFEESMQEDAAYPFLKMHKKLHERFVKRVDEFQARFKLGDDVCEELHNFMYNWLFVHIKSEDMDYVPSIQSNLSHQQDYTEKEKGFFGSLFNN
jgi:hemerythrin